MKSKLRSPADGVEKDNRKETRDVRRTEEYWDWVAVGLFLLLSIDLLTSLFASKTVGLEHESNPLMSTLISGSMLDLVAVHLAVAFLASVFFYALFETAVSSRGGGMIEFWVEIYLGVLVSSGLFIFANNLSVIVLGESIL